LVIGRLNHVAIATADLEKTTAFYRDALGATVSSQVQLPEHGVTVVFVELANSRIELLTPLGAASPIAGFLRRNPGGGVHHLCYAVVDIRLARERLCAQGAKPIGGGEPRIGARGRATLFLHPRDCGGVLIELEQEGP
jgi:methylmalonyl-CoA/ethylmalonyl-CoA epimerase